MTSNFVDQFGFNDEEFAEQEDNIKYIASIFILGYFSSNVSVPHNLKTIFSLQRPKYIEFCCYGWKLGQAMIPTFTSDVHDLCLYF